MAVNDMEAFAKLVETAKKALQAAWTRGFYGYKGSASSA
jgi:hypothetical protein